MARVHVLRGQELRDQELRDQELRDQDRALVLGGAGATGNAWLIGVIAGLFDAGLDVTQADLTIGTSAGSTAAAQITSGTRPTELLAEILSTAPPQRTGPIRADGAHAPIGPAADHMERMNAIIAVASPFLTSSSFFASR